MMLWLFVIVFVVLFVGVLLDCYLVGIFGGIGFVLFVVGLLLFVMIGVYLGMVDIVWWMVLCGVGFGLF